MVILLFTVGILIGALGGILMKLGAQQIGSIEVQSLSLFIQFLMRMFTNIYSIAGVALYFSSAIIWQYLLTKLDISLVQPVLALTYVATPILAIFILGENVPPIRWVGIIVIIIGVFIVARSAA